MAKAFAPANISLLFKVVAHKDPAKMGSLGTGFTVNEGVTVKVETDSGLIRNQTTILFNGNLINFPTVTSVVNKLTGMRAGEAGRDLVIDIRSKLPLGSGFGLSGASALATAYAINTFLSLGKSNLELAKLAHTAEVKNKTGLGDVINQYYGGFFVKFVSSSQFKAVRIPINNVSVYCHSFGKLEMPSILKNPSRLAAVDQAGERGLEKIKHLLTAHPKPRLADILIIAKEFAKESGLLTSATVKDTIRTIEKRGGNATMIMLGEAVISGIPFEGAIKLTISDTRASVLE